MSHNTNGGGDRADIAQFLAAVILVVLSTVLVAVVGSVITQAVFDDPTVVQEISVSGILCAGALWALVILVAFRR